MPASPERFFIIIRAPNGDVREVPLRKNALVIGRDESADVRVDDKKVSRRHAAFRLIDGMPWVEDLESANGVQLNDKKIDRRAAFSLGDKVSVGGYEVSLKDPVESTGASAMDDEEDAGRGGRLHSVPEKIRAGHENGAALIGMEDPIKGKRFPLHSGENILGRLEECDVPILDGSVSRQHARIVLANHQLRISDLGSSNGTFVNDARVDMGDLGAGDLVRIGNVTLRLDVPRDIGGVKFGPVKGRTLARKIPRGPGRRWLIAGFAVMLVAGTVLSATIYWRWRRRAITGVTLLDNGKVFARFADTTTASFSRTPTASLAKSATVPVPVAVAAVTSSPAETTSVAAVAPPAVAITSTSPFTRRDELGMLTNLPEVAPNFDFDRFVEEQAARARSAEQSSDYALVRTISTELLSKDPINSEARSMLKKVLLAEETEAILKKAEALVKKGRLARAVQLLSSASNDAPNALLVQTRAKELLPKAVATELDRADADGRTKKSWARAHERYKLVLAIEPKSTRALDGVRVLETKMRAKDLPFSPYAPPGDDVPLPSGEASDEPFARILRLYAKGSVQKAIERAEAVERNSQGKNKREASDLGKDLRMIQGLQTRIRSELAGDPASAWVKLIDLEQLEGKVLRSNIIKSVVARELEEALAESFAAEGELRFDRGGFEDAFQRWESGFKLNPSNPRVLAGLKKLEERAEKYAQDAETASQRGDRKNGCAKWRLVTRITRRDSEIHKRAFARAKQSC